MVFEAIQSKDSRLEGFMDQGGTSCKYKGDMNTQEEKNTDYDFLSSDDDDNDSISSLHDNCINRRRFEDLCDKVESVSLGFKTIVKEKAKLEEENQFLKDKLESLQKEVQYDEVMVQKVALENELTKLKVEFDIMKNSSFKKHVVHPQLEELLEAKKKMEIENTELKEELELLKLILDKEGETPVDYNEVIEENFKLKMEVEKLQKAWRLAQLPTAKESEEVLNKLISIGKASNDKGGLGYNMFEASTSKEKPKFVKAASPLLDSQKSSVDFQKSSVNNIVNRYQDIGIVSSSKAKRVIKQVWMRKDEAEEFRKKNGLRGNTKPVSKYSERRSNGRIVENSENPRNQSSKGQRMQQRYVPVGHEKKLNNVARPKRSDDVQKQVKVRGYTNSSVKNSVRPKYSVKRHPRMDSVKYTGNRFYNRIQHDYEMYYEPRSRRGHFDRMPRMWLDVGSLFWW